MAKKTKKGTADAVYAKKAVKKENPFATAKPATSKRLNPFEVHVNKEKFKILGRTCKHDKGLPGVSRAKAVKKRQATLGQEFLVKHKTNQFRDRRIGKHLNEEDLTEEVMNARFVADKMERLKNRKASRFILNDDEVLTHRGETLEEIEQFLDDRSEDEEAGEELDAEFTEVAHFGGDSVQVKDRKMAIDEMIMEQKRRKVEIAKEKDEVHDLTEKLDANYKDLISLMGKMSKSESEMKAKEAPDDYDKIMREMIFEPRGVVSDKLLTEEELAKQEKERLQRLENERLKRMQADSEDMKKNTKLKHRSADDLDDGYFDHDEEEEQSTLAYNLDGKISISDELGTRLNESVGNSGDYEDKEEGMNGRSIDKDNEDAETEDEESDEDDESEESDANDDEEDAEEKDNLSDLKGTDSESEEEEEEREDKTQVLKTKQIPLEEEKLNSTQNEMNGRVEVPFTLEMPASYNDFKALLSPYSPTDQGTIVQRLIKCNHPKLEGVNREKIVKLFVFLLQYFDEHFSDSSLEDIDRNFQLLAVLMPHMYDLMNLNPERMSNTLLGVIKEKYAEYRKNAKQYPSLETLVFFKLVSNFCSTSDFRHPVATPCYIFMQHILSKARVRTRQDIAMGLFLVTLVFEYSRQSKRFLPAVFNFLLGIVYLSIPIRPGEIIEILPPFASAGPLSKLLAIAADSRDAVQIKEEYLKAEDLVTTTYSIDFKVRALNQSLKLIHDIVELVSDNVGSNYFASPLLEMLGRLPLSAYPTYVEENYVRAKAVLEKLAAKSLTKLVPPERKPKALRLLEPRIEPVYDDKRRPKLSKEKEERAKLLHKVKRETKGALREIRRDTEFLQKIRIQQQLQSDMERKEKVKRIYQEAAIQQGELNELARAKKKKKY